VDLEDDGHSLFEVMTPPPPTPTLDSSVRETEENHYKVKSELKSPPQIRFEPDIS